MEIIAALSKATPVVKGVLIILGLMSLGSWSVIIYKAILLRSAYGKAVRGLDFFSRAKDLREAVQSLSKDPYSPLYHVAQQGITEFSRLREAGGSPEVTADNVRRALRLGVNEIMSGLGSSVPFLATCANTAPFIGLFGTVWGIMHSFNSIAMEGKASLSTVAPGISEALIATAIGLFVAIPATVGYNAALSRLGRLEGALNNFAGLFLNRVQGELNAAGRG
ncbi:MAG: MotA/TolQ/ExbB proton channel family protein [Desulfovibrionaceae bacterium]|nr:MotA/TolQ/ExbB proton channel family protein [Desulfovibrionaceae bacterium]